MQFLTVLVATLLGISALIFVLYPVYERMRQNRIEQNDEKQGNPDEQGGLGQGNHKSHLYYTRNTNPERSIVGAGLAPALDNLAPTLKGLPPAPPTTSTPENAEAERQQAARTALQEIELDFQLGNLAETDYRSLRERYMRRALLAMKSRRDREQKLDEAIEEQLRRMREMDEQAKEQ